MQLTAILYPKGLTLWPVKKWGLFFCMVTLISWQHSDSSVMSRAISFGLARAIPAMIEDKSFIFFEFLKITYLFYNEFSLRLRFIYTIFGDVE